MICSNGMKMVLPCGEKGKRVDGDLELVFWGIIVGRGECWVSVVIEVRG